RDHDGLDVFLLLEHDAEIVVLGGLGKAFEGLAGAAFVDVAQGDDVFRLRQGVEIAATPAASADDGDVESIARFLATLNLHAPQEPKPGPGGHARLDELTPRAASPHG